MPRQLKQDKLNKRYRTDFSGGVNLFLGPRQIKDNESPEATNVDFNGKGGIKNRDGYSEIGDVDTGFTEIYGMTTYQTPSVSQLIKFAADGTDTTLFHSTDGGAWVDVNGTTFTKNVNMDVVQAVSTTSIFTNAGSPVNTDGTLFSFNGVDGMVKYDGTSWASHTGGTVGLYGAYFDNRLWCVDETNKDTLNISTKSPDATKPFDFTADGTSSEPRVAVLKPGSGAEIRGLKVFQNALYAFLYPTGIFKITPASEANAFVITEITDVVGCVSHRSIAQVEEDLFFAADDGIYSLGEIANFVNLRTTNKSGRIQEIFDDMTAANKANLVGVYHNFKYHLFYSFFGTANDSCYAYDVRYRGWQDWRNMAGAAATTYVDSTGQTDLYFGTPATGEVFKMYDTAKDNGAAIQSTWYSKSFDEATPDVIKLFMDSTFVFDTLNGQVDITIIFDDDQTSASATLSQNKPMGGFGSGVFGRNAFGGGVNTETITLLYNQPLRIKDKQQKYAIQYRITSSDLWALNTISQTFIPFSHYKIDASLKLN